MGLEVGTYIADLVATNPLTSDQVGQGDDHLRLIKSVLQATFPNLGNRYSRVISGATGYTVLSSDNTALIDVPTAATTTLTHTFTMPAAASITAGFYVDIRLSSANDVGYVYAPSGASIEGSAFVALSPGTLARAYYDGTTFKCTKIPIAIAGGAGYNFSGAVSISGSLFVAGVATISGAVHLKSQLSVSGSVVMSNRVVAGGDLFGGSNFTLSGAAQIGSTLSVSGATVLGSGLTVAGAATISGAVNLTSTLSVGGVATFAGAVTVSGTAVLQGNTYVGGTFDVGGKVSLSSSLVVGLDAHFNSTVSISGAAVLKSTLNVEGATTLSGAAVLKSTLNVEDAATISGAATLKSTLNVEGAATISGAAVLKSTLNVEGAATISGATVLLGTLRVDGTASFSATVVMDGLLDMQHGRIKFPATQNASTDANTLDDYEEGTWTPTITYQTVGNLNVVYSTQNGSYTKIGRFVYVSAVMVTSTYTHTTSSGEFRLAGLPFTVAGSTTFAGCIQMGTFIMNTGRTWATPVPVSGQTYSVLTDHGDGITSGTHTTSNHTSGVNVSIRYAVAFEV